MFRCLCYVPMLHNRENLQMILQKLCIRNSAADVTNFPKLIILKAEKLSPNKSSAQ